MKKETENQESMLSEGIAKAKRVVRRAPRGTESEEEKKPTRRGNKVSGTRTTTKRNTRGKEDSWDNSGAKELAKPGRKPAVRRTARGRKEDAVEIGKGLKIIPLGGLEQIGMNITAFEYEDSIVVVDCGLSFPEDDMLGIDLVIPDVSYLKENIDKIKGFVITHGEKSSAS